MQPTIFSDQQLFGKNAMSRVQLEVDCLLRVVSDSFVRMFLYALDSSYTLPYIDLKLLLKFSLWLCMSHCCATTQSLTKISSAKLVHFPATSASFSSHDQMFTLSGFVAVCPIYALRVSLIYKNAGLQFVAISNPIIG